MTVADGAGHSERSTSGSAFADALKSAIADRKITLVSLQEQLSAQGVAVSLATLSYWRSGARHPDGEHSLATVEAIEIVLDLAPNSLASLVVPAHRLGRLAEPGPVYRGDTQEAVDEVLHYLEAQPASSLREVSAQMHVHVGKSGHIERSVTRSLVQATTDVLTELPFFDSSCVPLDVLPVIRAVSGADIVREYVHPSRKAWGYLAQLHEPVLLGESTFVEIVEEFPPGFVGIREASHGATRISKEMLIWVTFHPEALPTWCEATSENSADDSDSERQVLRVAGNHVHAVRHNFGPGVLRLSWGYDAEPAAVGVSAQPLSPEE